MTAKKKEEKGGGSSAAAARHHEEYEQAVKRLAAAIDLLHGGNYAEAREQLTEIAGAYPEEPELVDRARSYALICDHRLADAPAEPDSAEALYYQAVMCTNDGELDEALRLFDRALAGEPGSARVLYARASAWALKGNAESAVADLRQAIGVDPQTRFQALNDPDFEKIREEPSFIDIIEPTPTGA